MELQAYGGIVKTVQTQQHRDPEVRGWGEGPGVIDNQKRRKVGKHHRLVEEGCEAEDKGYE